MNNVMHTENVTKIFPHPSGSVEVLKGINFNLEQGKMSAILGRSGTGKSTFLQILGTLDRPTQGKIFFRDQNLLTLPDKALSEFRNRHLGFVFQFHYLLPEFSALENVMMPAWISKKMGPPQENRAKELLRIVNLEKRLHHRPMELSGGEQQRVSLARALMNEPEVVLTDELTGNLDQRTGEEVLQYLQKLNQNFGVTVLSVTHQRELAFSYYSEVFQMDGGTLHKITKDPS